MADDGDRTPAAPDPDDDPTVDRRAADRRRDGALVAAALAGDQLAFGTLYDAWFDRVHALVVRIVRDRDVAEEVCQDAFLAAWRNLPGLQDQASFGGWLLRIARNRAFDRSEREGRSTPIDDEGLAVIESTGSSPTSAPTGFDVTSRLARAERPEVAAEDGEIAALVREATAALAARDAEALELQLRDDLTPAEIGEVMGLNRNAANQLCHRARARFATAFGARMLWRGSRPACPRLEAALAAAGVSSFGPAAVTIADRHAADCDDCSERRRLRLQPTALFAAVPVMAAPMVLKTKVAGALAAEGVPMQGSAAFASSSAGTGPSEAGSAGEGGPGGEGGSSGSGSTDATAPTEPPTAPTISAATGGPSDPRALARSGPPDRARRRRNRRIAAGSVVAVVVLALIGGGLALRASSDDRDTVVAEASPPDDQVVDEVEPALEAEPPVAPPPSDRDEPPAPPPTTEPPTTSTVPDPPVIESLTLRPATDRPPAYPMTEAPVLSWSVSGADQVEVWMLTDTGSGPQRTRVLSNQPTGSLPICPGTVTAGRCSAPSGTYLFVVEAENAGGQVVSSDTTPAPRFVVVTIIR